MTRPQFLARGGNHQPDLTSVMAPTSSR